MDANGFLGVEKREGATGWSEAHPLTDAANHLIASLVRKLGGFTFQELNLSMEAIRDTSEGGPDLSYDFITRPAAQHALLVGDVEFLRLTMHEAMRVGIDTRRLVHALQNHDELTYELVHFTDTHASDVYTFRGRTMTGGELADTVRSDLLEHLCGDEHPYNLPFTTNGIACTTATVAAASQGLTSLTSLTDDEVERIRRAHLLLAAFNALQPGVFALSGWDLVGALTLDPAQVADLLADADTRWINRGGYDLVGVAPEVATSAWGMPVAPCLYGPLPAQLADPDSFASRLRGILALRSREGIAEATLLEVPETSHEGTIALAMRLPDGRVSATVLNFSSVPVIHVDIRSQYAFPGHEAVDLWSGEPVGIVDDDLTVGVWLGAHDARALTLAPP